MNAIIFRRFSQRLQLIKQMAVLTNQRLLCSTTEPATQPIEDEDMPTPNMKNPYEKEKKQCILCRYNIHVDYKNPRLLSQFVSPFSGLVYEKHITGLCEKQQRILEKEIIKSRKSGFMPYIYRDPRFVDDPKLFNPLRPQRPNPH